MEVPEKPEMNRRCYESVKAGRAGYEQRFRLISPGRVLWLHESVSITKTEAKHFHLVGLTTDVTAQQEAELARRASEEQLNQLMTRADCMLWLAHVTRDDDGTFRWEWFVPRSELYRRLAGDDSDTRPIMPWGKLNVPEFDEIEARSRHAISHNLPGYEQEFRVIKDTEVFWMHEQTSIAYLGPNRWKLEGVVIDITTQRRAEEARRKSEERLGSLLDLADCLVWEATVTLKTDDTMDWAVYTPKSVLYRRLFGDAQYTPETDLYWRGHNVPEYPEMEARALGAIKSSAPGYAQDFHMVKPDRVIWLHEVVTIKPLGPGKYRLVGVITDISARRDAEAARRNSEERLRNLLTRADCILWEALAELTTDSWTWKFEIQDSKLCQKLYGAHGPDWMAGLWLRFKIPEFDEMNHRCRTAMIEGRSGYKQIFHIIQDDGGTVWIKEIVTITPLGGSRFSLVGVAMDITSQYEAELALAAEKERLAVTLHAMAEAVITTDRTGRVLFINPVAANLTQWKAEAVIGRPIVEICRFENSHNGALVEVPVARVAGEDCVTNFPAQTWLVTPGGEHRLVEGCCAPIHSPDSKVTGTVLVFRDVTEQDQLEQQLVRATRLESVGILAGGIAHDFNNILTAVMGNLTLAQLEAGSDTEVVERLREAEKATLRARDLTQQLLTFAKGGDPVRGAVQLEALLRDTVTFALHGSSVQAIYDIPADLWPADADKGQIGRVIQNLVINAVQAMPRGGMLRFNARNEEVPGHNPHGLTPGIYLHLTVADNGEGIPRDHLSRIFDPYFTTKQTGSGLGLAAVYSIIKKHRGYIAVDSRVGEGTTFRIWLPALQQASVEAKVPVAMPPVRFTGRVLFLDDEEIIRKMATRMLQQFGFEVECAAEGREAVEKYRVARARGQPFTLVIMDLTVPGGFGGREAIKLLREIDPKVKAIVSSGYSSDPVLANFRAHGFCGVMAKPYQFEDIMRVLTEALAG
jgi:PAS domain S-box-containing protein